jgi:hypothetical protein
MHQSLNKQFTRFLQEQKIFFVATAAQKGRINLSPKGLNSLKVLNEKKLIWMNLTGSGNETAAHLLQDPRITIMACSFTEKPLILRIYGRGKCIHPKDDSWDEYIEHFKDLPGARQIIKIEIDSVQNSCGYGVPILDFVQERDTLNNWSSKEGDQGIKDYWEKENLESIDGFETGMQDQLSSR